MRRDIQNVDDDIIRKKRIIEQALYSDPDIVEVLDDADIDPSCPEDLLYSSIWPFIRIPGVQDKSKN
jgi:type III secretion system FlhB-like substrate exporter